MATEEKPSQAFRDPIILQLEAALTKNPEALSKLPIQGDARKVEEYYFQKSGTKDEYSLSMAKVINVINGKSRSSGAILGDYRPDKNNGDNSTTIPEATKLYPDKPEGTGDNLTSTLDSLESPDQVKGPLKADGDKELDSTKNTDSTNKLPDSSRKRTKDSKPAKLKNETNEAIFQKSIPSSKEDLDETSPPKRISKPSS